MTTTTYLPPIQIRVTMPMFGKTVATCQCGAYLEFTAWSEPTNKRGRPPKKTTAFDLAERWATAHVVAVHPRQTLELKIGEYKRATTQT
jgi:hypothetical protein